MGKLARDSASKKEKRSHTPLSLSHTLSPSHSLSSHHLTTRSNLRRPAPSAADHPRLYTTCSHPPSSPRRSLRLRRRPQRLRPSEPYFYPSPSPSPPSSPPSPSPFPSPSPSSSASDSRRREKKLTVVLRLNRAGGRTQPPDLNSSGVSAASSCDDDSKPLKKRRLSGPRADADGGDGSGYVWSHRSDARRKQAEKSNGDAKTNECISGEKNDNSTPGSTPLPDAKTLEFILHKLQKKDTYDVYAEPVDPNELPDYHDVIEHPMDFGTIRKKLGSGAYTSLEQFESDVFLICTNAMYYNAPDTIYYKQAYAIQELARKRFDKIRVAVQNDMELESAEKARSNSMSKKSVKSVSVNGNEPVGSDFTSGTTLANTGETCAGLNNAQTVLDKSGSVDGPVVDTNPFLDENKSDKADDPLVRGLQSKFERKPFVVDENRRLTYNNSDQPETRSEPVFSTFESEVKQLVVVGLHADHSYARSLARFAATLGPVAWRIASRRIEQALPAGYKFGRGWVGDYEPLQTPVLSFNSCPERQLAFGSNSQQCSELNEVHVTKERSTHREDGPKHVQLSSSASAAVCKQKSNVSLDGKPGWFGSIAAVKPTINKQCSQQQRRSLNLEAASDYDVKKETETICSSAVGNVITNDASFRKEHSSPATTSRLQEMALNSKSIIQPIPFKQPEAPMPLLTSEHASKSGNVVIKVEDRVVSLPNGRSRNYVESTNMLGSPSVGFISNHQATLGFFSYGNNGQSLNDQVKAMMMLSGKIENQPKSLNSAVVSSAQIAPRVQSVRRDCSSAAATAAAKAWMSIGAQGLKPTDISQPHMQIAATSVYNPTRELPHSVSRSNEDASGFCRLQLDKNRFSGQSLPQNLHFGPDVRFENSRPVALPQLVAADLSKFQVQSPWQGLGLLNSQQKQKSDMLPPDLNIGFQPPASPVHQQSSGIQVDSQQPDLALQL